ncbi:LamG-like jellyroll fold domain-containing protein [Lacinutrix undariae]
MKNTYSPYIALLYALFFSINIASQTTIAKNEFLGSTNSIIQDSNTASQIATLTPDDTWGYRATVGNGSVSVVDDTGEYGVTPTSAPNSLMIRDWHGASEIVEFDNYDVAGYTDIEFSLDYASEGNNDNNQFYIQYAYNAGGWETAVLLIDNNINQNFGVNQFTLNINDGVGSGEDNVTSFKFKVYNVGDSGGDRFYIDDAYLRGFATAPPNAICKDVSIVLDAFGQASITGNDIDNGSTVGFGPVSLSVNKADFTCDDLGTNTVTLTVEDVFGDSDTCTSTVTVVQYAGGLVAPIIADVTAYCEYTVVTPANSGYQCEDITPTTSDITTFTTPGAYSVTWLYTASDDSVSVTQNITIIAQEAPSNIVVSDIDHQSALVTWDEQLGVGSYGIRYRVEGETSWVVATTSTNSYDITGLSQLADYQFQVSSVCGGSEIWSSTQTFSTILSDVYCVPTSNSNGSHYITNFSVTGENSTFINNGTSNGDDGGYGDYTNLPTVEVFPGSSYTTSITVNGANSGWGVYIDLNHDGVFYRNGDNDPDDEFFDLSTELGKGLSDIIIDIPATASLGKTVMRVGMRQYWSSTNPCGNTNNKNEEFEDYIIDVKNNYSDPELSVSGGGNSIPGDASNTPLITDFTNFGSINIGETTNRVYTLTNLGYYPLIIDAITFSNTTDFSLTGVSFPFTINGGESTIFTVEFFAEVLDLDTKTSTITIQSNSINYDTSPYFVYNISASKDQKFYDSDGDGIFDNVDIDDDNDGIPDEYEEQSCNLSPSAVKANYKFLNETFGEGIGRSSDISILYDATTTYCLEDGDASDGDVNTTECPNVENASLYDGEYTVHSLITTGIEGETVGPNDAIANFAWYAWAPIEDHTPGDTNGRMAIFNADVNPGVFYETTITGTIPNVPITYSFWAVNIDNKDSVFSNSELEGGTRIKPNIRVNFLKTDYSTIIKTFTTGEITRCESGNDCDVSIWKYFEPEEIITSETTFIVQFINESPGGNGNDLAIDDINIQQTLCDMDGDGIADTFDLDSDNDGIPDVVEAGFASSSNGTGKIDVTWIDVNKNGMLDSLEGETILDTDGDGIPNYLDLDSDNDGLFDVDESGAQNSNNPYPNFINGDGDINGDGVGDGPESELFRIKDTDGDENIEYYGDGILDVYDYYSDYTEGASYANTYGNNSQGIAYAATGYTLDSDNDGIPDYLDVYNNLTSVYDIDTTIYTGLDADNDGVIDDETDSDGDGVVDSRDGNDTIFGSPRDLNESYSLYFDGRNDYVEADNALNNTDATIMAFVKTDGDNALADGQIIAGQNKIFIRVSPNNRVIARVDGINISGNFITQNVWEHVAVTTTAGKTILYINGIEVASIDSGSVPNDTSKFRIGSLPNNTLYFKGEIEEVRVFDRVLTPLEIKHMVHQELDENENFNKGKIIPKTIGALNSNLIRYYKMDGYQDDILDDKKTYPTEVDTLVGAKLYNIKDIYFQTAPLPYVTESDGDWTSQSSWLHGDIWDITTKVSSEDDASIVHVKHNLNTSDTQGMVGLLVDDNKEFSIKTDKALYNSWYLKLDGFIDLEGESQLIQKEDSDLYNGTNAKLERDQQGTVNLYTYNYWSSPVHTSVSSSPVNGSENFSVADVLYDGTDATSPAAISYVEGYDGDTSPMKISNYWLWKFDNYLDDNYADWQSITSGSRLNTGVGYTMKGTSTDALTGYQNYIFAGKPNNGTVKLNLSSGNNYLVGNPYPSAIDGYEFILDNEDVITGTLYFWEHYGGDSHILAEYQGGYGLYNLSGGVPAIADLDVQQATPDDDVSNSGTPTKTPRQYIPVAQGFFVVAQDGGDVTFENDQRIFVKEGSTNNDSWFFRQNIESELNVVNETDNTQLADERPKFRIDFVSPNNYWRQLLLTVDENTTTGIDWAYDGAVNEENAEDMLWRINEKDFIIQAIAETAPSTILPLSVKTLNGGEIKIHIHDLENVPLTTQVYLKDNEIYHDLRASEYITTVYPGVILDRFKIVFSLDNTLSIQENLMEQSIVAYYNNQTEAIEISNMKNEMVNSVTVFNLLGQKITEKTIHSNQQNIILPLSLNTGVYIFKITTDLREISHKMLINSN